MSQSINTTLRCTIALLFASSTALVWADPPATPKDTDGSTVKAKQSAESKDGTRFLRVLRGTDEKPIAMETAIVRYVPSSGEGGLVVDLIAVVHMGDRLYYQKLNRQFEQYDAMLYELVAPPDQRVPGDRRDDDSLLAMIQKMSKAMLDLESQLDHINYKKKNFVHADLSPAEMAKAIAERGDDAMTLFLGVTADLLRQQNLAARRQREKPERANPADDFDPFAALFDTNGPVQLKRMMAEQMAGMLSDDGGLGNTLATILIKDRNQAAMRVFQKEIAKGKKRIAIFYGAAHMPDFEKRLVRDFDLKRDNVQWLTAWDLARASGASGVERIFKSLLEDLGQ